MLVDFGIEAGAQDLAFGPASMFTQAGTSSAQTIGGCPRDAVLAPGTSVAFAPNVFHEESGHIKLRVDFACSSFSTSAEDSTSR